MYRTILLAAALQHWDRYSAHALAAREVAGSIAIGATHHLHVLSVYDYKFKAPASGLSAEMLTKLREEDLRRAHNLMEQKIEVTTQLPKQLRNRDRSVYAPSHEPSNAHRPRHP